MPVPSPGDGASEWIRTTTVQALNLLTLPLAYARVGAGGEIRTHTVTVLSRVTLPLAYAGIWCPCGESNPDLSD